jgi:peptide/nickel transport system substrate-binding protein
MFASAPRFVRRLASAAAAPMLCALPTACSDEGRDPVTVSVVGTRDDFAKPLPNLPNPGAKLILEATAQGLVAFDASGDILPALAQRWIVEDDGRSYIFRLRRAFWANGARVTAPDVARMLMARIESLRRFDPDGPLDAVQAVVPMTGEVIEIRMAAPRPYVLQMLAQPQMALVSRDGGTGPYRRATQGKATILTPVDRDTGDDSADEPVPPWDMRVLRAERAALAIIRFREGDAALVLGGRFTDLPLLVPAGIDRKAVRVDPVRGLLGLAVTGQGALLDDPTIRAAINMSIARSPLPTIFPLGHQRAPFARCHGAGPPAQRSGLGGAPVRSAARAGDGQRRALAWHKRRAVTAAHRPAAWSGRDFIVRHDTTRSGRDRPADPARRHGRGRRPAPGRRSGRL